MGGKAGQCVGRAELLELRIREADEAVGARLVDVQVDQAGRLVYRQRPQQDLVDEREHRGVRPDAKSDRDDAQRGDVGVAPQGARSEADVLDPGFHLKDLSGGGSTVSAAGKTRGNAASPGGEQATCKIERRLAPDTTSVGGFGHLVGNLAPDLAAVPFAEVAGKQQPKESKESGRASRRRIRAVSHGRNRRWH